jgi:hypothetical protein
MTKSNFHPERSLARSAAICQTQSKDPYGLDAPGGDAGNFRVVIRFFDEHACEQLRKSSREGAAECSPRRKP